MIDLFNFPDLYWDILYDLLIFHSNTSIFIPYYFYSYEFYKCEFIVAKLTNKAANNLVSESYILQCTKRINYNDFQFSNS